MTAMLFGPSRAMKFLNFALIFAALTFSGCSISEKYAANQAATASWLDSKAGKASVRVSGLWEPLETGWGGAGRIEQQGNRLSGALGSYTIRGSVSGSRVYLAFISGGWTYYTASLQLRGNILGGYYSSSVPFSSQDQGSLNLRRIGD